MASAEAVAQVPGADDPSTKINWWDMRARRTQAMPKHSLFGTNMENVDMNELQGLKGKYIPEGPIKPNPNRYPLPDFLKPALTGQKILESSRKNAEQQRNIVSHLDHDMQAKAAGALAFKPQEMLSHSAPSRTSNRPTWLTQEDLEHSKEINIVGLGSKGSYNRDKYGKKPKKHNYSLIGDIMAKNMDFNSPRQRFKRHEDALKAGRLNVSIEPAENPEETNKKKIKTKSLVELPRNLQAIYGTNICDNLFSDKDLVGIALEKQRASSGPPRPSKILDVESLPFDLKNNYERLGQAMRYNVIPGLTTEHTISRTKNDFNDEVHLRRVPCTDEYRYQRDGLSTWSEHNVLRERMKKAWNEAYPLGDKKQ